MSLCKNFSRKCVHIGVLIFLVAASAVATQAQVVFSPPKNISNSSGNTQNQQIAVDARGNINIIWLDDGSGTLAVLFSRSSDGGVTFSMPQNISNQTGSSANSPQIAVDSSGNIFVIWTSFGSGNSVGVFFTRSTDSGATFSAPQTISNTGANGFGGQLAVDSSGNIDVVWSESSAVGSSVFFGRSVDGGASFSPAQNLSGNSFGPQIAVDASGNINVTWVGTNSGNREILFSRSTDGGSTFFPAYVVESVAIGGNQNRPPTPAPQNLQIAIDRNGGINLLWSDASWNGDWFDYFISFSRSADGGLSFFSPRLVAISPGGPGFPTLAVGPGGDIDVISNDNTGYPLFPINGIMDVLTRSVDGGATFSSAWSSGGCGGAGADGVAVSSIGEISVVYQFFGGPNCPGQGIFFTRSSDGTNFSTPQDIFAGAANVSPTITLDSSGNSYVAWQVYTALQTSPKRNIYFSRSVGLSSLKVSPADLAGGSSTTGTVTLNAPAPAGGTVVSLSSSDPSVSVPASVTVPVGATSATFAVTTNTVSATTNATISATFNGTTQTAGVTVRLVYNFSGYLAPLLNDGSSLFHSGRTIPIKFQLTAPDGSIVTNAVANVQVFQIQNTPTGTVDQDMSVTASGSSSSGTAFRFDPTSNQYIYNLNTSGYASGTYLLRTTISDGSAHDVQFSMQ